MNELAIRFTLDKMMINESKEFQAKVYESVEQLLSILRVEELSYETLGLIIMLEKINEKETVSLNSQRETVSFFNGSVI